MGEGVANLGAHFTAVEAGAHMISIAFKAELANGATKEDAKQEAAEAIEKYFRELVLTTAETANIVIRISTIGAILSGLQTLLDYSDLRINEETHNIIPDENDVPVLEEVEVC